MLLNIFKKSMGVIGSIGQLLFYFQAFSIFSHQHAGDVSSFGFLISFFSLTCWLVYGITIKDKPLVIANTIGVIGAFFVLIGIILYS
mgnify:CR=1 FL=1